VINAILVALKFVAGFLGNSAAMIADATHSLSDFITDILVLVFVRISSKPQDENHEYGHGKYETIASFLIALGLFAVAITIIVSGATAFAKWLQGEQLPAPDKIALWAALLSIAVKELLYQYTVYWGNKLDSQALKANAWHHRSDSLSSIGAAIGIGGALLLGDRWTVLDPLASIVVGAMLLHVTFSLLKGSIGDLTECALPKETEQEIQQIILSVPDVHDPHQLRTRRLGNRIAIEVHVRMDGAMPLNDAHQRASLIEQRLRERFGEETHVVVHTEPDKNA
jgi:cation diffusion facilitator family transporter